MPSVAESYSHLKSMVRLCALCFGQQLSLRALGGGPGLWVEGLLARGRAGSPCCSRSGTSSAWEQSLAGLVGRVTPRPQQGQVCVRTRCTVQVRHPLLQSGAGAQASKTPGGEAKPCGQEGSC